jgi:ATP-binding protein involved in chromosome partitioning
MDTTANSQSEITKESILDALRGVAYPGLTRDLVSFGMVDHVAACAGSATIRLSLREPSPETRAILEERISSALRGIGVEQVAVEIVPPKPRMPATAASRPDPWSDQVRLASARHVIAIGAGKGGVGKSTVAINLALALARAGVSTALLDADIYGPSLPLLLGIDDGAARIRMSPERHILPLEAHGVPIVSFGFFLGEQSPAIWRGPMVSKAVKQFARGVAWPAVDVLIVDLPPGTGDVPLSLAQAVVLSGAVVVTQPPRVAIAEARKACAMFQSLEVPVLGIVENMTGPFGRGAGADVADRLGVPFLGEIPFDHDIVIDGDAGTPTVVRDPRTATALEFARVAGRLAESLQLGIVTETSE